MMGVSKGLSEEGGRVSRKLKEIREEAWGQRPAVQRPCGRNGGPGPAGGPVGLG